MFGYLVATSLSTHLLGVVLLATAPAVQAGELAHWVSVLCGGVYVFLLGHLLSTTALGLYMMSERIPELRRVWMARQRGAGPSRNGNEPPPTDKKTIRRSVAGTGESD